jgi:hypothetical protein
VNWWAPIRTPGSPSIAPILAAIKSVFSGLVVQVWPPQFEPHLGALPQYCAR